jgi:hypothetical protein
MIALTIIKGKSRAAYARRSPLKLTGYPVPPASLSASLFFDRVVAHEITQDILDTIKIILEHAFAFVAFGLV